MGKQEVKKIEKKETSKEEQKKPLKQTLRHSSTPSTELRTGPLRMKAQGKKKRKQRSIQKADVMISSSYNNTVISFTDPSNGEVLCWSSPGCIGFTGSRKSTAYAATKAAEDVVQKGQRLGIREGKVIIKGVGLGRQAAVKGLKAAGLVITSLADETPIPHNGCRSKKRPRGS